MFMLMIIHYTDLFITHF